MRKTMYATRKYVTVEAEVSLDDFDEDDLVEYMQGLGYFISKNWETPTPALVVYEAMKTHAPNVDELIERFVLESANRVTL